MSTASLATPNLIIEGAAISLCSVLPRQYAGIGIGARLAALAWRKPDVASVRGSF
jgi:hypothetical protein